METPHQVFIEGGLSTVKPVVKPPKRKRRRRIEEEEDEGTNER